MYVDAKVTDMCLYHSRSLIKVVEPCMSLSRSLIRSLAIKVTEPCLLTSRARDYKHFFEHVSMLNSQSVLRNDVTLYDLAH